MIRYVVDASVAAEYLLKTPLGMAVAETMKGASLIAPELLDVEVLSVLRRTVLAGHVEEPRALTAIEDLARWPVERVSHRRFSRLAWEHIRNVSAYDAIYVATASAFGIPLLTADARMARAPGLGVLVQHVRVTPRS